MTFKGYFSKKPGSHCVLSCNGNSDAYPIKRKREGFKTIISILNEKANEQLVTIQYNTIAHFVNCHKVEIFLGTEKICRLYRRSRLFRTKIKLADTREKYRLTGDYRDEYYKASERQVVVTNHLDEPVFFWKIEERTDPNLINFEFYEPDKKAFFIGLAIGIERMFLPKQMDGS